MRWPPAHTAQISPDHRSSRKEKTLAQSVRKQLMDSEQTLTAHGACAPTETGCTVHAVGNYGIFYVRITAVSTNEHC